MFQLLDWEDKKYLDVLDFLHITELLKLDLKLRGQNLDFHQSSWVKFARYTCLCVWRRYTCYIGWRRSLLSSDSLPLLLCLMLPQPPNTTKYSCLIVLPKLYKSCRKVTNFRYKFSCRGRIKERTLSLSVLAFYVVMLHTLIAAVCTLGISESIKVDFYYMLKFKLISLYHVYIQRGRGTRIISTPLVALLKPHPHPVFRRYYGYVTVSWCP